MTTTTYMLKNENDEAMIITHNNRQLLRSVLDIDHHSGSSVQSRNTPEKSVVIKGGKSA